MLWAGRPSGLLHELQEVMRSQSYPMSMKGSLAAAELSCWGRGQPPGTGSVHGARQGSVAIRLRSLGKAGKEEKESRRVSQKLRIDKGKGDGIPWFPYLIKVTGQEETGSPQHNGSALEQLRTWKASSSPFQCWLKARETSSAIS